MASTELYVIMAVILGFLIGAGALWFVHRDVVRMSKVVEGHTERLDLIELVVERMETRQGDPR